LQVRASTYGTFIIKLKNWASATNRKAPMLSLGQIYGMTGQLIKDGRVVAFAPPMISGFGTTNGF